MDWKMFYKIIEFGLDIGVEQGLDRELEQWMEHKLKQKEIMEQDLGGGTCTCI